MKSACPDRVLERNLMNRTWLRTMSITGCLFALSLPAHAICSGAATPEALDDFKKYPGGWIAVNGTSSDLGIRALALAATAVNVNDPDYGKGLGVMLGQASSDQGRTIGTAISGLERSCSDPKDPADIADKRYISLNILPNLLSNLSANVAYGEGSGPETTSTGAPGGGGAGTGPVDSELPTGGSNGGSVNDASTSTPTTGDPISVLSAGAVGSTFLGETTAATVSTLAEGTGSGPASRNSTDQ